jgi:ribosomal protein L37AE/L43A
MFGAAGRHVAMAVMACSHCGELRRVRTEGQFVSCDSCGKVLQERGRKQHAVIDGGSAAAPAAVAGEEEEGWPRGGLGSLRRRHGGRMRSI